MKKDNVTQGKETLSNQDELITIKEIDKGLSNIENAYPIYTPNLEWFEQKVIENKETLRKRFLRDLMVFWFVSIMIVSVSLLVLYQQPIAYLFIQVIAIMTIIFVTFVNRRKQVIE